MVLAAGRVALEILVGVGTAGTAGTVGTAGTEEDSVEVVVAVAGALEKVGGGGRAGGCALACETRKFISDQMTGTTTYRILHFPLRSSTENNLLVSFGKNKNNNCTGTLF